MSLAAWTLGLLATAMLLAWLRASRRSWAWILLQPAMAALLFFTLFPPPGHRAAGLLVVATGGTTPAQLARHRGDGTVIALPEASLLAGVQRVADLGSALREHAQARELLVLGSGLPARDRDHVGPMSLRFYPAPLPRGLLELHATESVVAGSRWALDGRVHGLPGGSVELLDPAGTRVAGQSLPADGRFQLHGAAPVAGRVEFTLRIRDAGNKTFEILVHPVEVVRGERLRVWVVAGGPSPELKYLRRWAVDAGLSLHTQISTGRGLRIGDPALPWTAASLQKFDLVVLDERAWRELGGARRQVLDAAVRAGLGVLLRVTGPLSAADRAALVRLGFVVTNANIPVTVRLPASAEARVGDHAVPASSGRAGPSTLMPTLTRQPLRVAEAGTAVLRADDGGAALALWRNAGRGRWGVWWFGDTYRLALAGYAADYGRLWSEAFAALARSRPARSPVRLTADPRPQQRAVFCQLEGAADVAGPDGVRIELLAVPALAGSRCAAFWPTRAGWHVLESSASPLSFHVRPAGTANGIAAYQLREQTLRLVTAPGAGSLSSRTPVPGPRWPWFLAWLIASGLVWWLERRERGESDSGAVPAAE